VNRYRECDLEDWLYHNPAALGDGVEMVGRQVRTPHGVLDLLAWAEYPILPEYQVIELKARLVRERDVAQCLRYCFDLREACEWYLMALPAILERALACKAALSALRDRDAICPYLIGPDITPNANAVLEEARGIFIRAVKEIDGFRLDWECDVKQKRRSGSAVSDALVTQMTNRLIEAMRRDSENDE